MIYETLLDWRIFQRLWIYNDKTLTKMDMKMATLSLCFLMAHLCGRWRVENLKLLLFYMLLGNLLLLFKERNLLYCYLIFILQFLLMTVLRIWNTALWNEAFSVEYVDVWHWGEISGNWKSGTILFKIMLMAKGHPVL